MPAGDTHELPISNAVTPPHEIGQDSRGCSNRHARPVRDQPNRLLSCVVVARLLTSEITVADDRSVATLTEPVTAPARSSRGRHGRIRMNYADAIPYFRPYNYGWQGVVSHLTSQNSPDAAQIAYRGSPRPARSRRTSDGPSLATALRNAAANVLCSCRGALRGGHEMRPSPCRISP